MGLEQNVRRSGKPNVIPCFLVVVVVVVEDTGGVMEAPRQRFEVINEEHVCTWTLKHRQNPTDLHTPLRETLTKEIPDTRPQISKLA